MKKRMISILLVVCMLCALLPMTVSAASTVLSGTCGSNVKYVLDSNGKLRIYGSGEMFSYSNNYGYTTAPWNQVVGSIKTVVIENGVTTIGSAAFVGCTNLSSISIPASVTKIGSDAFYRCQSLSTVTLPAGLTQIGKNAFYDSGITEINIPSTVTSIGEKAFYSTCLTSVILPQSVTSVSSYLFYQCDDLTSVTFQGALTGIGAHAFYSCSALENVTFANGMTGKIEEQAFAYCSALKSFDVPVGTTTIGSSAFEDCTSLADVTLPEGLESILDSAFTRTLIANLRIPSTVTYMDSSAFSSCTLLKGITIYSATVERLQTLSLPNNLVYAHVIGDVPAVDNAVFGTREAYFTVYYDEGTSGWTQPTWQGYLTKVWGSEDPDTIATCGENLTWKLNEGTLTISGTGAMRTYTNSTYVPWHNLRSSITKIVIADGVTNISNSVFNDCNRATSVTIPDSVTSIGWGAFDNCYSLTSLTIPANVTSIGQRAFANCSGLTSITIPAGVTEIAGYVFSGCSDLTSITIPDSVTKIGGSAFYNCTSLTNITIPDDVTYIGSGAFGYCSSLSSINIPDGVTSIEWGAFQACSMLTSITIPDSVTSIDDFAFQNCNSLTAIHFCGDAPSVANNVFGSVTATAYYPCGNETWTEDAMQNYGGNITWVPYGEVEKFDIDFAQVILGNALNVNFAFPVDAQDDWTGAYAVATKTYADGREDLTVTVPASEWKSATIQGAKHYYFSFSNVSGKEMADNIYVTIYNAEGEAISNQYTESIRSYVMRILDDQDAETRTMLVDMLNYGSAAQASYTYGTDNLANSLLSETQKAYGSSTVKKCTDSRVKGANYQGTRLVLKNSILMQFGFSGLTADMTAKVEFTNHRGTKISETVTPVKLDNGSYAIEVNQIVAADGRIPVTVTVYDADGNVYGTATDSMESYLARMGTTDPLYAAIMMFSDAAYAYLH